MRESARQSEQETSAGQYASGYHKVHRIVSAANNDKAHSRNNQRSSMFVNNN